MTKVLFVCLGNICRSPAAQGVFRKRAAAAGLNVEVDSAGTGAWHAGDPPDERMQQAALRRGYDLSAQRARRVDDGDGYS
ncbi:MAG: low molecular weight phosphotyrosine protein phosphatase, partial [Parvularculaceae bacterium]|nr:low molecular weight phosphotyrosine protein phosphatase [Parvularculaceae bacterium]